MRQDLDLIWTKSGWADRWDSSNTLASSGEAQREVSDPFQFNSKDNSTSTKCEDSDECASGFACVGGDCVKVDSTGTSSRAGNSASSAGSNCQVTTPAGNTPDAPCGGPTGGSPGSYTCTKPGCGGTGGTGGGAGNSTECCGATYTRCDAGGCLSQCVPFENTTDNPNDFCTQYFRANGSYGAGCTPSNTCSECSDYDPVTRSCVPRTDAGAPCYCQGVNCLSGLKCERDQSSADFGKCVRDDENTFTQCACQYTCPCGKTLQTNFRQPVIPEGQSGAVKACPTACREYLAAACDDFCPPAPKDPCVDSPSEPCLTNCSCQVRYADCGEPKPSKSSFLPFGANPDQWSTKNLGSISSCGSTGTPEEDQRQSWIERVCYKKQTPECQCSQNGAQVRPCPNGQKCDTNGSGQCEDDPDFDNVCETNVVCGGQCCSEGASCVQGCYWTVNDVCHGQGFTFIAPCSPRPILTVIGTIPATAAICGRYHTHCSIQNLAAGRSHLDCQAGLINAGPTGGSTCGS